REEPGDGRRELLAGCLRLPEELALLGVVHGRAAGVAEPYLAEELGVVGDGGEVERAIDPAAPRLQLVVVGEWNGRAGGERGSVARPHARPEDVGVGGGAGGDGGVGGGGGTEEREAGAG